MITGLDMIRRVARGDIPTRFAFPAGLSVSPQADQAIVLLALNDPNAREFNFSHLQLVEDQWILRIAHKTESGLGVSSLDSSVYAIYVIERAPVDASNAIFLINGQRTVLPVENGYAFAALWEDSTDLSDVRRNPPVKLVHLEP